MGALSKKELERKRSELFSDGIMEVIDAQNVKEYRRRKRAMHRKQEEDMYNDVVEVVQEMDNFEQDDVLNSLSSTPEESRLLLEKLHVEKKKETTSIEDIDWKDVKTF